MAANLKQILTEATLRRMASTRSFERGVQYFNGAHVRSIVEQENGIAAKVEGAYVYRVRLWIEKKSLDYSCTCPVGEEGEFCKHCVALGLAWLEQQASNAAAVPAASGKRNNQRPAVTLRDARAYLSAQDTKRTGQFADGTRRTGREPAATAIDASGK